MNAKRISLKVIAVLSLAVLMLPAMASAQPGESGQVRGQEGRASAEERREAVEARRAERTADIEQRVTERQAQVRQDVCERREDQMGEMIPRLSNQSSRIVGAIDGVHDRVQGFYESGQLTMNDYEAYNEAVEAARADAHASVEVVASYEFEFDCDNPSVGDQLFGFRETVAEARDSLKQYRSELVVLISSLRAEAAQQAEVEEAPVDDEVEERTEEEEEDDA